MELKAERISSHAVRIALDCYHGLTISLDLPVRIKHTSAVIFE